MAEAMVAEAYRVQTQVDAAEASKALEHSGLRVTKAREKLEEVPPYPDSNPNPCPSKPSSPSSPSSPRSPSNPQP